MISEYIKNLIDERPETDDYKYMLLDRMKQDCRYFLGNGGRYEGNLWSKNAAEHIENMKALYNSFSDENKPSWLTMEDIKAFETEMLHKPEPWGGMKKVDQEKEERKND